jgi:phage gpG-like protein
MKGLASAIRELSEVPRAAAAIAAPKISLLLNEQFERGADPYGRPWAPLARATLAKGRRPPPLTDKGKLRAGTFARLYPGRQAGIQLVAGAEYGKFHQYGFRVRGRQVPARPIFPDLGIPFAWWILIKDAIRQVTKATLVKR